MRLPLDTSARAKPSAVAKLVNCQPEALAPDAKGPARIMRSPGVRAYRTGHGPGRGLHVMGGVLFSVQGEGLYANDRYIGPIPGSSPVSMADNGTILVIAAEGAGYSYDGTLAKITDVDFPGATEWGYIDGYFTFLEPGTAAFWLTGLFSTSVDALSFDRADTLPDSIVQHVVDHREVVLLGERSIELWYWSGASAFPLERSPSGMLEIGCLGGACKQDNSVFWVANDVTARRLTGNTPQRISTHAVEERMRTFSGTPRGFSYALDGHLCVVFTWDDGTLIFDSTTGSWHERQSYLNQRWRVCDSATIGGTVYVQDRDTGGIGILDPDVYEEWGETIVATWTYPAVYDKGRRLFHSRLEINAQMGVGAEMMGEFSDDGGFTWTSLPIRSMGSPGAYTNRIIWTRLGSAYDRVYRMSVSDAAPVNVYDTNLVAL